MVSSPGGCRLPNERCGFERQAPFHRTEGELRQHDGSRDCAGHPDSRRHVRVMVCG